jgi:hypothetical protein
MTPFFLLLSEMNMELTECCDMTNIKTCKCSGVLCTAAMNAFLPVSTLYFLSEENMSLFLSVGATFSDIPGTGETF